jgi:hypothetical protein
LYPISSTNDIVLAVYENIGYDGLALDCLEVTKIQGYLDWIEFFLISFNYMTLVMDMVHRLSISMEGIDYCSNGYDSGYGYGTCYQSQWRGLITAQMVMSMVMDMVHYYQFSFEGMITTQWLWLWTMDLVMGVSNTPLMFAFFKINALQLHYPPTT